MAKSKVYYTDMHITGERNLLQKLEALMKKAGFENIDFKEKFVAVKVHFGEPGNLAYLRANYAKVICDYVKKLGGNPFVTDCNTLQVGGRKNALDHLDSAYTNGYNTFTTGVHTIIADGLKGTEERLVPVEGGEYVKEAKIGSAIMDADIIISLNHFKGHELTGFGGALKNLGMGCGSRAGKMEMHSAGKPQVEQEYCVGCGRCIGVCPKDAVMAAFDEANDVLNFKIAEYTKAVIQNRPNFHINMVVDVSTFCDCHAENDVAIVPDVGMFVSFDHVAVDKACADAVNKQPSVAGSILEKHGHSHNDHFKDVSPETNWISALEHGEKIGIGTMDYELEKL